MKHSFYILLASTILVCPLSADMIVELDVDGQFGNGPDTLIVSQGDSLIVDVWIEGDGFGQSFGSFGVYIVDNGALTLTGGEIIPPSWSPLVPISETGDTVIVAAYDPFLVGLPGPSEHAASLVYEVAAESGIGSLEVDLTRSLYAVDFSFASFDGSVGAHVEIQGTSAAGESSWGNVKQLFR